MHDNTDISWQQRMTGSMRANGSTRARFRCPSGHAALLAVVQLLLPLGYRRELGGLNVGGGGGGGGGASNGMLAQAASSVDEQRLARINPIHGDAFATRLGPLCEPYSNSRMALRASAIPKPRHVSKLFWLHVPKTGTSFGPTVVSDSVGWLLHRLTTPPNYIAAFIAVILVLLSILWHCLPRRHCTVDQLQFCAVFALRCDAFHCG